MPLTSPPSWIFCLNKNFFKGIPTFFFFFKLLQIFGKALIPPPLAFFPNIKHSEKSAPKTFGRGLNLSPPPFRAMPVFSLFFFKWLPLIHQLNFVPFVDVSDHNLTYSLAWQYHHLVEQDDCGTRVNNFRPIVGVNYKWWCQNLNFGDPHDCLVSKYKPFGKKICFLAQKKPRNPSAQTFKISLWSH